MFVPLKITTEYSLLKSTIKIDSLISFLKNNNITSAGICDDNLFGVMEFYTKMLQNNLKPIIGLKINIEDYEILLYATNYQGYLNLLKIHTLKEFQNISFETLNPLLDNIKIVLPSLSYDLLEKYPSAYLGYVNDTEKINALLKSTKVVYIRDIKSLSKEDTNYLSYLEAIDKGILLKDVVTDYSSNYLNLNIKEEDALSTVEFIDDINITLENNPNLIPKYNAELNSYEFLYNLAHKGLAKRLKGNVSPNYLERLNYELSVIKKMGFVDYFLIFLNSLTFLVQFCLLKYNSHQTDDFCNVLFDSLN